MLGSSFHLDHLFNKPLIACLLSCVGVLLPIPVLATPVAVLKSQENANQWTAITERLQNVGVNYCILQSNQWQSDADLNKIKVLIIPNVETISGLQAGVLSRWLNRGGKIIVTGPAGNLSEPAVRNQLRSLFGAYWAYPHSQAYTLRPTNLGELKNQKPLASSLLGGVVIPTGVNSQTVAVWGARNNPPAVVLNNNSIFLGWRWGSDAVANLALDSAWLETALQRYGINRSSSPSTIAPYCQGQSTIVNNINNTPTAISRSERIAIAPRRPLPQITENPPSETARLSPNTEAIPPRASLTPQQISQMTAELQGLIGRYGVTLLALEASNSNISNTDKSLAQAFHNRGKNSSASDTARRFRLALENAQGTLNNFQNLIAQGSYTQAREFWLQARRNLWDNYPTNRQFAQPEIRAMWLDRGTIVEAKNEEDLAKVFDRMAAAGINVVFFETVNASYTIYPSQVAPEQNPLTRGWDPLKVAVKLAHERNMEIHAWVWVFAAANQAHNKVLEQPLDYLGPVLSRNPDWGATNKSGGSFDYSQGTKKAFFDPANPEVQNYLLSLYEEIVKNYDVDGLQLDYIRYPFQSQDSNQTYGYGKSSRWLFKQMTGVDPITLNPRGALWEQWTSFKIRQVDTFVSQVSTRLKQIRPQLKMSAAVFPLEQKERLYRIQQNWEEWGQNQWIDLIFLMTYALDTGTLEDKTQSLFDRQIAGNALIIPGIRLLKVPDQVTIDQLQFIRNLPTSGFALFATENLNPNLQTILNRIQGSIITKKAEPLPHRQPFKTAAARFNFLRQEWSFLITNNLWAMEEGTLKTWGQEVDEMANLLEQLANNPSPRNLTLTQNALKRFSYQFKSVMSRQKDLSAYQIQVWENRLATLQSLLSYGQRVEF